MADVDLRALVRNARALVRADGTDHPHRRGMEQAARGDHLGAVASFREAIAAVPDAPWSYVALADVLAESGELADAADAYRAALTRSPENAVALRESIAAGLARVGEAELAVTTFRAVLAAEPQRATAATGLAKALLAHAAELRAEAARLLAETDDLGDDEHLLEAAVEVAPRVPALYRRLAESLAGRGDLARAIAVIQIGLAHDPDDPESLAVFAELLAGDDTSGEGLSDDERERLLAIVERAVAAQPDDRALLVRRARLLARFGSPGDAVEAWRAVVAAEPTEAEWHRQLGDRLAETGDFEAAGVAYDRAVALGYQVY
jgi:tetratricopeptide (TPR) repeat protein